MKPGAHSHKTSPPPTEPPPCFEDYHDDHEARREDWLRLSKVERRFYMIDLEKRGQEPTNRDVEPGAYHSPSNSGNAQARGPWARATAAGRTARTTDLVNAYRRALQTMSREDLDHLWTSLHEGTWNPHGIAALPDAQTLTHRVCDTCHERRELEQFFVRDSGKRDRRCLDCLTPWQRVARGIDEPTTVDGDGLLRKLGKKQPCAACSRPVVTFPRPESGLCRKCDKVYEAECKIASRIERGLPLSSQVRFSQACRRCRKDRPLTDFEPRVGRPLRGAPHLGLKAICTPCRTDITERPKTMREEVPGSHTPAQWEMLCYFFGYRCLACERVRPLSRDHIIPITLPGSSHDITNLQPLCLECNSAKNDTYHDYRPAPVPADLFEGLPEARGSFTSASAWSFQFTAPTTVYDWEARQLVDNSGAKDIWLTRGWRRHVDINFDAAAPPKGKPPKPRKPPGHIVQKDGTFRPRIDNYGLGIYQDQQTADAVLARVRLRRREGLEVRQSAWLTVFLDGWYEAHPELRPAPTRTHRAPRQERHARRPLPEKLKPYISPPTAGATQDRKSGDWRVTITKSHKDVAKGAQRIVYLTVLRDKALAAAVALEARRRYAAGGDPHDRSWIKAFVTDLNPEAGRKLVIQTRRPNRKRKEQRPDRSRGAASTGIPV